MKNAEKIIEELSNKATLKIFKVGCDEINYKILNVLPHTPHKLEELFNLSSMPMNKRINNMFDAGLIKKNKKGEKITTTKLGKLFLKMIKTIKKDVVSELINMI